MPGDHSSSVGGADGSGDHVVHRHDHPGDPQAGRALDFVLHPVGDALGCGGDVQPIADSDVDLDDEAAVLGGDADALVRGVLAADQAADRIGHPAGGHGGHAVAVLGGFAYQSRKVFGGKADIAQGKMGSDHNRSAPFV